MQEFNKKNVPAIEIRNMVILPNNEFRVDVANKKNISALFDAEDNNNDEVVLLIRDNFSDEAKTETKNCEIAVLAKLILKVKLPSNNYKCKFKSLQRVSYEVVEENPHNILNIERLHSIVTNQDEEIALLRLVINEILEGQAREVLLDPKPVLDSIQAGVTSGRLSDIIAQNLKVGENEKLKYLTSLDISERLKFLLKDFEHERYIHVLEDKINAEVKRSVDENQKEYYLREKMKAIQDELGDKVKKESEIDEYREAIEKAKLPKKIKQKATDELERYRSVPANSGESGIIKTYLDTLLALPWSKKTKDNNDLNKAESILDQEHFGLERVKERIVEYLAVKQMTKKNPPTILCLAGPPGVGKTSLAKRVAESLNRKFVKQSLGGVKDESEIRGHRRTYLGALPGRIIQGMKSAGVVNPVFLLDEIDKMSSDYKGDPASAMLEVLDPEQNKFFSDHYLEENYDLSQVMFICTANYLGNVPEPLRDRMEIVELSSYTEHEKLEICRRHLVDRQLKDHGLTSDKYSITDEALYKIIRDYTREAGVRQVNRLLGTTVRKTIKGILKDEYESIEITESNLSDFLGKPLFSNTKAEKSDQIGVVTGLAYTQFGGDILPIEITTYKGKGKLVLTGKLGDVMKESAMAALSYVKTNCDTFNIDIAKFDDLDIHIHAPEGAVPKDGPSAGVTLVTALVSTLSNKKVSSKVGMTGEVTLRGRVLPIGGLREKSIAAHRSGLTKILIPKANERDLDDIPESIKSELTIIPCEEVSEVLKEALVD